MVVEQIGSLVAVAGQVKLSDAIDRDGVDVSLRGEAVVVGAHVDVVDVEQEVAVGPAGDLARNSHSESWLSANVT